MVLGFLFQKKKNCDSLIAVDFFTDRDQKKISALKGFGDLADLNEKTVFFFLSVC